MTSPASATDNGHSRHLDRTDEMSLAEETSAQTVESVPDTLEVRDDSLAIVEDTMSEVRRPLLMFVAVAGAVALLAVAVSVIIQSANRDARDRAQ